MNSWFHVADGLFFRRTDEGVQIGKGTDFDDVEVIQTIDHNSWCSVIASVCNRGEDHLTWQEAQDFHSRELPGHGREGPR